VRWVGVGVMVVFSMGWGWWGGCGVYGGWRRGGGSIGGDRLGVCGMGVGKDLGGGRIGGVREGSMGRRG